ncbi:MAG: Ig-like domain-containing protein [Lachnospiraceae bacterium]|nr:Ig-like domain-containing protein [Lachnospiraceae bacterium]
MAKQFLEIEDIPEELKEKVKQDLKFRTGIFVWRVKFNTPLDPSSVNNNSMFVSKTNGERMQAKIRYDAENMQIEVEPLEPYSQNEPYLLNITTQVKSKHGQKLNKPLQIKFKL